MLTARESGRLIGAIVLDQESDRIGEVRQVFVDEGTEAPTWVGVRLGVFGGEVLVPLAGADWDERALHAAVTRSSARTAPPVDLDAPLSIAEHELICRHYGIPTVRYPREDLDPDLFVEDGTISYSVQDVDMVDDDRDETGSAHEAPLLEQRDLGKAMEAAAEERTEGVSGHMLSRSSDPSEEPKQS
ncbi:PRC-barrel domain-containing protein [Amnibacterium endophyticum]|uniref:PRC-barrel domain-containing protein n=1 Tax=Amnibacterium endophyticum TaxID=2109337 RepID=A0ABW4LD68_9MICO